MLGLVYVGFLITALIYTIFKRTRQIIKRMDRIDIDKLEQYIAIHGKEEEEIKKKGN